MKILIITDASPYQTNGVVTTYLNLQKELEQRNISIDFIYPEMFKHFYFPFYKEIAIPLTTKIIPIDKKYDHVHIATEGVLGWLYRRYCLKNNILFTTSFHTNFDLYLKNYGVPLFFTQFFLKKFHSKSKKIFVTTDSMYERLSNFGIKNMIVWSRGVSDIYIPSPTHKQKILLNVGRVSKEKNLEEFYKLKIKGYKKVQVGDGPLLDYYKQKYPDVEFVGTKKGPELVKFYQDASVFVFPSKTDTFGIVNIEAISCGTPVAAHNVTGPKDIITQEKNGYLSDSLHDSVIRCLNIKKPHEHKKWSWGECADIFIDNINS